MSKPLRLGDIVEIPTSNGLAYAQYTHRLPQYGGVLRILPGLYHARPASFAPLVRQDGGYPVLFPVQAAVTDGTFAIVGHEEIREDARAFPLFRAAGRRDIASGRVEDWWLWDGKREWHVGDLTPEQYKLPLRELPSEGLLAKRLAEDWTPERERGEGHVKLASSMQASKHAERGVDHYLYFPTQAAARRASQALLTDGYRVDLRRAATGRGWLVLARQAAPPGDSGQVRSHLEQLASSFGGTYDGSEAYVGP